MKFIFAKQSPKRFRQQDGERELLMNISMKWINFFIHKGSISCWCTSQFSSYKSTVIPHKLSPQLLSTPRVTFHVLNEKNYALNYDAAEKKEEEENRFPNPRILIFFFMFFVKKSCAMGVQWNMSDETKKKSWYVGK